MKVKITPSRAEGCVKIPPSKSMAHRAVICAALADGVSLIENVAYSEDIRATIGGMRSLGADIDERPDSLIIKGTGGNFNALTTTTADCRESGSTLRFLLPIYSLTGVEARLTGSERLFQRPQKIYETMFKSRELIFEQDKNGITIHGKLTAGLYEVEGSVSSQFISGLLFTLPLLQGDSVIKIKPPFESASYMALTLEMLERYGISIKRPDPLTLEIKGEQTYKATDYMVEGDYSQLGFFAVLGAINGDITCTGLNPDSKQGDRAVIDILQKTGVKVDMLEGGFHIRKGRLQGTEIDLADCPDLGPVLCVMGMYANGTTHIYNAGRLRIKECDRIHAMETELLKAGVDIKTTTDEIFITGKGNFSVSSELCGHNDHRIVMSLAVAATLFESSSIINGAEAVNKSYPAFFEDLKNLNVKIEYI